MYFDTHVVKKLSSTSVTLESAFKSRERALL